MAVVAAVIEGTLSSFLNENILLLVNECQQEYDGDENEYGNIKKSIRNFKFKTKKKKQH